MNRLHLRPTTALSVGSLALVSVGVAGNPGLEPTLRTVPALVPLALGLACLANVVAEYPLERLRHTARRWWIVAFAAFLPYALATAPSSPSATAAASALSEAGVVPALEAFAGGTALCAITTTVVYGFAAYGLHPGAPSPEERVLEEQGGD